MRRREYMVISPVDGIHVDMKPENITDRSTPFCENVIIRDDVLMKSLGCREFAGTVSSALNGVVLGLERSNGYTLCHTTTKFYILISGTFTDKTGTTTPDGDADNIYSRAHFDATYIFTNGKQVVQKWDYNTGNDAADLGGSPPVTRWLLPFGGRLNLYDVQSGGTEYHRTLFWSVVGDPEDWSGAGSGNAEITALEPADTIMRAEMLLGRPFVYGQNSIVMQEYLGEYTAPYGFYGMITGAGLMARKALANIEGRYHVFLGRDNVYRYAGGHSLEPIGNPIKRELFNDINPNRIGRSFMYYYPFDRVVRLYVPVYNGDYPTRGYELNVDTGVWTRVLGSYTCAGNHVRESAVTWNDLTYPWQESAVEWDDRTLFELQPLILVGNSSGNVYIRDDTSYDEAGSAITAEWQTKNFFLSDDAFKRRSVTWMEINFEARGHEVSVYYSTNDGASWTLISDVALSSVWDKYYLDLRVPAQMMRFKFANSGSGEHFEIKEFELGYLPSTSYRTEV